MEVVFTNTSSTLPTHISVPSVLLQIFTSLQTVQGNTSQPQVLVQILPQPHSSFIQNLQHTDRGKQLVEENRLLRLRAQELLNSVVHIRNVVEEFKEETHAAARQTSSVIQKLRRNQILVNKILRQYGSPNDSFHDFIRQTQTSSESSLQELQVTSIGEQDVENMTANGSSITSEDLHHSDRLEMSEEITGEKEECFPNGTRENMYSFVRELRELQTLANKAEAHLHIVKSNLFANSTWLHKGLENCLYFQEAAQKKSDIIKDLKEQLHQLQQVAGGKETQLRKGKAQHTELEDLKNQHHKLQQVAAQREEQLQEMKDQASSTATELKVAREQLQQYQNLAEESQVKLGETKDQLQHFQQLAEIRQAMLLEAKEKLAELQQNVTTAPHRVLEKQTQEVQKLVDGRQHIPQEGSSEDATAKSKIQAAIDSSNNNRIEADAKHKARLHTVLAGRSKEAALMDAAERGDVEQIEFLLDAGAFVDARDTTKKQTSLMRAAESGHLEACRLLIQRGANLETRATGWYNLTPLLYAAANGHLDVVKLLVENGADTTAKDSLGKTAAVLGGQEIQTWLETTLRTKTV